MTNMTTMSAMTDTGVIVSESHDCFCSTPVSGKVEEQEKEESELEEQEESPSLSNMSSHQQHNK